MPNDVNEPSIFQINSGRSTFELVRLNLFYLYILYAMWFKKFKFKSFFVTKYSKKQIKLYNVYIDLKNKLKENHIFF